MSLDRPRHGARQRERQRNGREHCYCRRGQRVRLRTPHEHGLVQSRALGEAIVRLNELIVDDLPGDRFVTLAAAKLSLDNLGQPSPRSSCRALHFESACS